jgi:hypothetical protein
MRCALPITAGADGRFGRSISAWQTCRRAFNHAGSAVGAGLSGLVGWMFGLPAVFWLAVAFAVAAIISVMRIPPGAIDDRAARGLRGSAAGGRPASGLSELAHCRPLLFLALAPALFHLGNAAMLPL